MLNNCIVKFNFPRLGFIKIQKTKTPPMCKKKKKTGPCRALV